MRTGALNYWWVNQSQSYAAERRAAVLWAPLRNKSGVQLKHWEAMAKARRGDLVLHYANGFVRALSTVTAEAVLSPRPASLPKDLWDRDGRLLAVRYRDATRPVPLLALPDSRRRTETVHGPFQQSNLKVKIGYLWPLSAEFATWFLTEHQSRFKPDTAPQTALPAEAREGAVDLLRRLIGEPLKTVTGSPNMILAVTATHALVRTERTPDGQPVPVELVERALTQLTDKGSVILDVQEIGYRSAFIGAVLLTLPGATATGSPPVISISSQPPNDDRTVTFEGELSRPRTAEERREQVQLRRTLIGNRKTAACALCGQSYPVRFLWAAHIKKRAVCTSDEKRDLANIAMTACLFGCDTLFEMGYIGVDGSGTLRGSTTDGDALRRHVAPLVGRRVIAHGPGNAAYFAWHYGNTFKHA